MCVLLWLEHELSEKSQSQVRHKREDRLHRLNPQHTLYTLRHTHTPPLSPFQLPGRPPYQGSDPGGLGLFFNPPPSHWKAGTMAAVGQLFLPGLSLKPQPSSHHQSSPDDILGTKNSLQPKWLDTSASLCRFLTAVCGKLQEKDSTQACAKNESLQSFFFFLFSQSQFRCITLAVLISSYTAPRELSVDTRETTEKLKYEVRKAKKKKKRNCWRVGPVHQTVRRCAALHRLEMHNFITWWFMEHQWPDARRTATGDFHVWWLNAFKLLCGLTSAIRQIHVSFSEQRPPVEKRECCCFLWCVVLAVRFYVSACHVFVIYKCSVSTVWISNYVSHSLMWSCDFTLSLWLFRDLIWSHLFKLCLSSLVLIPYMVRHAWLHLFFLMWLTWVLC